MIDEIRIAAELETELESDSCVWYGVEVMMMTMGAAGWVGYVLLQTVRSFPGGCTTGRARA